MHNPRLFSASLFAASSLFRVPSGVKLDGGLPIGGVGVEGIRGKGRERKRERAGGDRTPSLFFGEVSVEG